jgi:hypothetical protein
MRARAAARTLSFLTRALASKMNERARFPVSI